MKLLKDLLYTKGNENLDISRFCALLAVLAFLVLAGINHDKFEPVAFGGGAAALFAGAAGWIYARQRYEKGGPDAPPVG